MLQTDCRHRVHSTGSPASGDRRSLHGTCRTHATTCCTCELGHAPPAGLSSQTIPELSSRARHRHGSESTRSAPFLRSSENRTGKSPHHGLRRQTLFLLRKLRSVPLTTLRRPIPPPLLIPIQPGVCQRDGAFRQTSAGDLVGENTRQDPMQLQLTAISSAPSAHEASTRTTTPTTAAHLAKLTRQRLEVGASSLCRPAQCTLSVCLHPNVGSVHYRRSS